MGVIQDLIEYFQQRGILNDEQIELLRREGFCPPPDRSDEDDLEAWANDPGEPALTAAEAAWDRLNPLPVRKTKGRKPPKGEVLPAPELGARLAGLWREQRRSLTGLVAVARPLARQVNYREAPRLIRQADSRTLRDILRQALQHHQPPLAVLWEAMSFDGYRTAVAAETDHGPAVQAYRAILQGTPCSTLAKYVWLLNNPEVNYAYCLAEAQRRLVSLCGQLYQEEPALLISALRRSHHPVAYLALLIVYNAQHRQADSGRPEPRRYPRQPVPPYRDWQAAWSQAWLMAPAAVAVFFSDYFNRWRDDSYDERLTCDELKLRYPPNWDF